MIETFYELAELLVRDSRGARSLVASDRQPCSRSTRTPRRSAASRLSRRRRGSSARTSRRSARTTASAGRPRSRRSREWARRHALAALPNVGLANLAGESVVFPHATPEYFAEFAAHARELGARHRRLLRNDADRDRGDPRRRRRGSRRRTRLVVREREIVVAERPERETLLQRKLRAASPWSRWSRSASGWKRPCMSRRASAAGLRPGRRLRHQRQPARARSHEGLIASARIERIDGLETIPHLTPRDQTIRGLESVLLVARVGIRNVLAVTGDPPPPPATSRRLGRGVRGGRDRPDRGDRCASTAASIFTRGSRSTLPPPSTSASRSTRPPTTSDRARALLTKLEAGAQFAMTQVLFDPPYLGAFLERLGGVVPLPLLVGVFQVRSYQLALRLHNEVPGIVVPAQVQARLSGRARTQLRRASRSRASCSMRHGSSRQACTSSLRSGSRTRRWISSPRRCSRWWRRALLAACASTFCTRTAGSRNRPSRVAYGRRRLCGRVPGRRHRGHPSSPAAPTRGSSSPASSPDRCRTRHG